MKTARIYTNDLNRMVAATKAFVSSSTIRKAHRYIKLEFDSIHQTVTAMAVDGYRMSVENCVISDCDESFVAYIGSSTKLPSKKYATISVVDGEAVIKCDGASFGWEQPEGDTFVWKDALPLGEPTLKIGFNGNYLLAALQAAKTSAGDSFKSTIVLEFRTPTSPVIIRTNKDDIKMVLPVRIKED